MTNMERTTIDNEPMFVNLTAEYSVYCVRQGRHVGEWRKVERVGRKYGYLSNGDCFSLHDGKSHHPHDCNARANGFGFDVWRSKAEYDEVMESTREFDRLAGRLCSNRPYSISPLPADVVQKIHKILDEARI